MAKQEEKYPGNYRIMLGLCKVSVSVAKMDELQWRSAVKLLEGSRGRF